MKNIFRNSTLIGLSLISITQISSAAEPEQTNIGCNSDKYYAEINKLTSLGSHESLVWEIPGVVGIGLIGLGIYDGVAQVAVGGVGLLGVAYGLKESEVGIGKVRAHFSGLPEVFRVITQADGSDPHSKELDHNYEKVKKMGKQNYTLEQFKQAVQLASNDGSLCNGKTNKLKVKNEFRKAVLDHLQAMPSAAEALPVGASVSLSNTEANGKPSVSGTGDIGSDSDFIVSRAHPI